MQKIRDYEQEWLDRQENLPPERECGPYDLFLRDYANTQDPDCLQLLMDKFTSYIEVNARKMVPARHVEDLIQDTWVRILENCHKYDRLRGSAKAWIWNQMRAAAQTINRTEARYEPLCHAC
jgi:Sigma-70 region 2